MIDDELQPFDHAAYVAQPVPLHEFVEETRRLVEPTPLLIFYGDREPEPPPFMIDGLLPQTKTAILAGQWSTGKTFLAMALSHSCMTGMEFAGHKVLRTGGVLWLAAEGANEVDIRLRAAHLHRVPDDPKRRLPFARQAFQVPTLTDPEALPRILVLANAAKRAFQERYDGTELVLVVVDTMESAAGFADANNNSEAQKVMDVLRKVSDETGALVLIVDHFGKMVETGVSGASAKARSADAILAATSTRDANGNHTDRKLSVQKMRAAPTGAVFPFDLITVLHDTPSACAIEWKNGPTISQKAAAPQKPAWSGSALVLKAALERSMIDRGKIMHPFASDGAALRCVSLDRVRTEFNASYAAETQDAKRKQFKRLWTDATARRLVASREINGEDWAWFVANGQPDMDIA